jgi:hypothetical protein
VIKYVSDLRQVAFLQVVSSTNKTDSYDITEILLTVALGIIKPTNQTNEHIVPQITFIHYNETIICVIKNIKLVYITV